MFTLRKTDILKIKQKNGVHIGTVFILYKLIKPKFKNMLIKRACDELKNIFL